HLCLGGHIAKCSNDDCQNIMGRLTGNVRQFAGDTRGLLAMRAGGGRNHGASQLYGRSSLLSQTFAIGALILPNVAWGQVTETLPEVTVSAPRPAPVRRATPPAAPPRSAPSRRVSAPAASRASSPAPAPQLPAFQAVATTPVTGVRIDRDKLPAMVQTLPAPARSRVDRATSPAMVQPLPAADFSRDYSPNVVETFAQRIPGVTTNNVQGNEFATDLRYRGFAASPLQGTPQGLAVYMQGIRINEA